MSHGLDPKPEPGDPRTRLSNQLGMLNQLNAGAEADIAEELAYKTRCLARYCRGSRTIWEHLDAVHRELVKRPLPPRLPQLRLPGGKATVAEVLADGKVSVD